MEFAILFATALKSARRLLLMREVDGPNVAKDYWTEIYVKKAIQNASYILEKIDERWPAR